MNKIHNNYQNSEIKFSYVTNVIKFKDTDMIKYQLFTLYKK